MNYKKLYIKKLLIAAAIVGVLNLPILNIFLYVPLFSLLVMFSFSDSVFIFLRVAYSILVFLIVYYSIIKISSKKNKGQLSKKDNNTNEIKTKITGKIFTYLVMLSLPFSVFVFNPDTPSLSSELIILLWPIMGPVLTLIMLFFDILRKKYEIYLFKIIYKVILTIWILQTLYFVSGIYFL